MTTPKSARLDGRGGWTPGKPRNTAAHGWALTCRRIFALIDRHAGARKNVPTLRGLALAVGVHPSSAALWRAGVIPSPDLQRRAGEWLAAQKRR